MKKIYTTIFLSAMAIFALAQNGRKAGMFNSMQFDNCKQCIPQTMVIDTICNFELDDTLAIYREDAALPLDSGYLYGHNTWQDMAWAEKYKVTGSANVVGGAYLLFEAQGTATSGGSATAHVYPANGAGGKPGASLGNVALPFASFINLGTGGGELFAFTTPIAVADSFFMGFLLGAYTIGGPDTIGIVTSRIDNRSTTNPEQNCAMWSDGLWYYELTENWGQQLTFGLCAIVDVAVGVENYVSKGDLSLYAAYPNPSASDVTLNYSLLNAGKVGIEIFDAQGKSILKMNKGTKATGMHTEKVNVSSFTEGNYFYKVSTENGTVYSRFSVVK